jgi:hypothetical protein
MREDPACLDVQISSSDQIGSDSADSVEQLPIKKSLERKLRLRHTKCRKEEEKRGRKRIRKKKGRAKSINTKPEDQWHVCESLFTEKSEAGNSKRQSGKPSDYWQLQTSVTGGHEIEFGIFFVTKKCTMDQITARMTSMQQNQVSCTGKMPGSSFE